MTRHLHSAALRAHTAAVRRSMRAASRNRPMARVRPKPSAEFLRVWEEGYVADPATFAMMHTQAVVILEGGPLRRVGGALDR